jgi:hypothetical protein
LIIIKFIHRKPLKIFIMVKCDICGNNELDEKVLSCGFYYGKKIHHSSTNDGTYIKTYKLYTVVPTPAATPICLKCINKERKHIILINTLIFLGSLVGLAGIALLFYCIDTYVVNEDTRKILGITLVVALIGVLYKGILLSIIEVFSYAFNKKMNIGESMAVNRAVSNKDERFTDSEINSFWTKHDYEKKK